MKKIKILIVDDERSIREVIKSAIKDISDRGIEFFEAVEGEAGMRIVLEEKGDIDLIITDYLMRPGESGLQVAKDIQNYYPEIKVIMVTGEFSDQEEESCELQKEAEKLGIKKIFPKPFELEEFRSGVREVIGKI